MKKKIHPAVTAHFRKLAKKKWEKFQTQLIEKAEKAEKAKQIKG